MKQLQELEGMILNLIKELRNALRLSEWMYATGEIEGAEKVEFNDTGWKKVSLGWGVQWQAKDTVAWFRRKVEIPSEICGINLNGARLEGMFYAPLGGEIFVNGEKIAESENWLPDIIFLIKEKIEEAEKFQLAVKTKKSRGWGTTFFSRIYIDKIDDYIFQLEVFLNLLHLTQAIPRWKPSLTKQYTEILNEIISKVDFSALQNKQVEKAIISIKKAQKTFFPISKESRKYTIHLIGHAHIDMNWLWSWPATLNTAKETFKTVNKLMNKFPDFRFSQSQAGLYQAVEKNFPNVFELIKKRVSEKKWEVTATTWVEGDLNMVSGESLIRQILYAKKYIKEKFGVEPRIAWSPDSFGHCWTYPQILKKCGIDFYFAHRCRPKKEYPLFWWEAPDASRVLALVHGETYNYSITPNLCQGFIHTKNRTGSNHYFVTHGIGDHGGGPTLRDLQRVKQLQKIKEFPNIKCDFSENYYKAVLKEKIKLPVVKDELNSTFEGCYTTHGDVKMMNRTAENVLTSVETLCVINNLNGGNYPDVELEKAWQNTCFNQFHDILDGSGTHEPYCEGEQHAPTIFKETMQILKKITESAFNELAEKIFYKRKGIPIIVYNPLSWQRKDIVSVDLNEIFEKSSITFSDFQHLAVFNEKGENIPSQTIDFSLKFVAEVPSIGYRVYYLRKNAFQKDTQSIPIVEDKNSIHIENTFFSISIDRNSGCLSKLFHKISNNEISFSFGDVINYAKPYPELLNQFQIYHEKPHGMSAWTIGPISRIDIVLTGAKVEITEKGPVCVIVSVEHKILNSTIKQNIIVYNDIPRIDFQTTVDWQEKGSSEVDAPMLKVSFPTSITADKGCFEIPFGYIYRPANGQEYPHLKWMDLSGDDYGVSILNNAKYGCSIKGNTMNLT